MRSDVYYEKDEADIDLSPNWKVLFGVSVSRCLGVSVSRCLDVSMLTLTMHWKCQRRLACNSEWRESGIPETSRSGGSISYLLSGCY